MKSKLALASLCLLFARTAPAADLVTETIECRDGSSIEVHWGHVEVPENRMDPGSRMIRVAFLRVPSPGSTKSRPIFPLAGGPGGSSIEMVRDGLVAGGQRYLDVFQGDVVAIDQRGVGLSEPRLESDASYGLSLEAPGDFERDLELMRTAARAEAQRWRAAGVDLDGYDTRESADDIDAVRRALGYEQIDLWGQSYATHLALSTIRRHGAYIGRAVMIGAEGPDHTLKLPSQAQHGLEQIAALVAATPGLNEVIPDLLALVDRVLTRLEQEPVFVEVNGTSVGISKRDVQEMIATEIGYSTQGIAALPAKLLAMDEGDYQAVAAELLAARQEAGIWSTMQQVMDAASGASAERIAQIAREESTCLLGSVANGPFPQITTAWGIEVLDDAFRAPLRTDVPVLFIVGELDSRTPVSNAEELMEGMPNARLIVVENAAHGINWGRPDLRAAWIGFLAGEDPPVERITMPAIRFELPPSLRVVVTAEDLDAFVGTYDYGPMGSLEIVLDGERLFARIPERGEHDLQAISPTELEWTGMGAQLVLERGADGRLIGGVHTQNGREIRVTKVD